MGTQPQATQAPPVEVVISETITSLVLVAHMYLEPAQESTKADLPAAEIAIDIASKAFQCIEPRLTSPERSALARLLTDLRMNYVRKRGL
jgi:hypothetical protein